MGPKRTVYHVLVMVGMHVTEVRCFPSTEVINLEATQFDEHCNHEGDCRIFFVPAEYTGMPCFSVVVSEVCDKFLFHVDVSLLQIRTTVSRIATSGLYSKSNHIAKNFIEYILTCIYCNVKSN